MSSLLFNGATHQIHLYDNDEKLVDSWTAYNNVDRRATLTHLANRSYTVQDRSVPHHHTPDANGAYGLHGIIRFAVPGHSGVGVHSGRANAVHQPGPAHATMGCIRTTDEAMAAIAAHIRTAPLSTIRVEHNSAPHARGATRRNRHRHA